MRYSLVAALLLMGCYDPYYQQPAGPAYPPGNPPPQQVTVAQGQGQTQVAVAQGQPPPAEPAPPEGPIVTATPPPPQQENPPPPPYDGAVWCDGYWNWNGGTYVWVAGYWAQPPSAGMYWYPGGWVIRPGGGYVWVGGRWGAPGWRPGYRYVHARPYYYRAPVYRGGSHGRGRWHR
jgi:hypothetical protein